MATPTSATTSTATRTACGSESGSKEERERGATLRNWRQRRGKTPGVPGGQAGRERRQAAGIPVLDLGVPSRLDLSQGLHGQPAQPLVRGDEQRALPPSPGEGEAPRRQGELHVVPGRPVVLPVHHPDGDGHLPDVLLPS